MNDIDKYGKRRGSKEEGNEEDARRKLTMK
jgi:hypothetical protein